MLSGRRSRCTHLLIQHFTNSEGHWGATCERTFCHKVLFYVAGAGRSSEVERSLMVRWVVGSILHGVGPIELFLVPASAPRLV